MFTPEEKLNNEINENIYNEVKFELSQSIRESIIESSREFGTKFFFATMSAVNGKYDDLRNDVIKNKISLTDAENILQKLLNNKLINQLIFDYQLELIKTTLMINEKYKDK
jgi:hypothetical protein